MPASAQMALSVGAPYWLHRRIPARLCCDDLRFSDCFASLPLLVRGFSLVRFAKPPRRLEDEDVF